MSNKNGLERSIFDNAVDAFILYDENTGRILQANASAGAMHGYSQEHFASLEPPAFIHPDSLDQFADNLKRARGGDEYRTIRQHLCLDGRIIYVESHGSSGLFHGQACILEIGRDITERVLADRQSEVDAAFRSQERSVLAEIAKKLTSSLELKPGLILDQLRKIIDYTHAALFSLLDSALVVRAIRGQLNLSQGDILPLAFKGPRKLYTFLNAPVPIHFPNNLTTDPAVQALNTLINQSDTQTLRDTQSWIWVPMVVKARLTGGMLIGHNRPGFFTPHHVDLLLTVANQAAIALANRELFENAQLLSALQERQKLAQSLHDAVNQSLFSAALIAEVLPRLWERDPDEARRSLEDLRRLTSGAMAEMRAMLVELRISALTDTDLGDLLGLLGHAITGRTNIPVNLTVSGQSRLREEGNLPPEVQIALYRICQEGLNNITRHAYATQVTMDLDYEEEKVKLRLVDNGRGFDPDETPAGHFGLAMIRERAAAIGAELEIRSEPGQGAEIIVQWQEPERGPIE